MAEKTKKPTKKIVRKKAEPLVAHEDSHAQSVAAVGRRKRATARVKLTLEGKGNVVINERSYADFFKEDHLRDNALAPIHKLGRADEFDLTVKVQGGGMQGQSDAVKLGVARALVILNPDYKSALRAHGFLTRDPREKERKKFGLKKARKRPQWAKR